MPPLPRHAPSRRRVVSGTPLVDDERIRGCHCPRRWRSRRIARCRRQRGIAKRRGGRVVGPCDRELGGMLVLSTNFEDPFRTTRWEPGSTHQPALFQPLATPICRETPRRFTAGASNTQIRIPASAHRSKRFWTVGSDVPTNRATTQRSATRRRCRSASSDRPVVGGASRRRRLCQKDRCRPGGVINHWEGCLSFA